MTKQTQIRIFGAAMAVATVAGLLHKFAYKLTPMSVKAWWFPLAVIVHGVMPEYPDTQLIALVQYPLFALAFALGVRRSRAAVVLLVLLCFYLGTVLIAFRVAEYRWPAHLTPQRSGSGQDGHGSRKNSHARSISRLDEAAGSAEGYRKTTVAWTAFGWVAGQLGGMGTIPAELSGAQIWRAELRRGREEKLPV